MADENNPLAKPAALPRFVRGGQLSEAEQKHSEQRTKIARAQRDILGPAVRAMREQGLDNEQIAAALEYASKALRAEHRPADAS